MDTLRFWPRRRPAAPSPFYEPTPYCDRLTLAEPFAEDDETRPSAEDRRTEPIRPVEATVTSLSARSRR